MTECSNCGYDVRGTTQKNLKGRTSAKSIPQECPECGHVLKKSYNERNSSLLNK